MSTASLHRIMAAALLIGVAARHYVMAHQPAGTSAYQAQVREAARLLPSHIGSWVGQDRPVPTRVHTVLRPNVIVSRHYTNVENGLEADLLLVHCSDAHSMVGHYPLRCYPAEGWIHESSIPRDWTASELRITGTEYVFRADELGHRQSIVVANCLLVPGRGVFRDMNAMAAALAGVGSQARGVGQIQISFDASTSQEQRDKSVEELIGGYRGIIEAILAEAR